MTSIVWNPVIYSFCNPQFRTAVRIRCLEAMDRDDVSDAINVHDDQFDDSIVSAATQTRSSRLSSLTQWIFRRESLMVGASRTLLPQTCATPMFRSVSHELTITTANNNNNNEAVGHANSPERRDAGSGIIES